MIVNIPNFKLLLKCFTNLILHSEYYKRIFFILQIIQHIKIIFNENIHQF